MLTMMRRLLLAPIFEDEETTRIAALLNLALLSLLAVAVPFSLFVLFLPNEIKYLLWLTTFATALLSCISLWLLRLGHVQTASRVAIAGFWLILTVELIPLGGLHSPVYSAYFIVILMTGLLLGGRAAIVVAACSILASLGILLLEARGLLPVVEYTSSAEWILKAAFFFVIAVLIYLAIGVTEKALARSRQIERALTERNRQLEREIADRITAEQKLRESEKMFRTLVESAPQSILLVNRQGEIVLANPKVQEMFGYTSDELTGKSVDALLPERYLNIHQTHRAQFAAHPSTRPMGQGRDLAARRKDGSEFPVEIGLSHAEMDEGMLVMAFVTDITERRRVENRVRESEAQLRAILDGMPIGCILNDTESRFTYWNPAAERMFGYRFEEAQGKQAVDLIVPAEFANSVADFNQRVLQGDGTIRTVGENLTSDGQRIICEWTCTPLRNSEGTAAGIIAMCQDITQRKQLEDALERTLDELEQRVEERTTELRAAQERLHFLLSSTPVVIYSYRAAPDYRATFVSNRVIDLLGYEPHNFIEDNRFWITRVHPDDTERIALETSESYHVGRGTLEYRFRCADGEYRWLHDENRVVSDAEGNPVEIIGYWIDITEQKQAEIALRESEERFRAMSEAMPIGIVVTRMATGEALFLNDTHAGLFGLTRDAYLQHDPSDFWVDFSMRQEIIEKVQQQGYIHNHELHLKKGDGTPFWALYSSKVISFGGEPAVLTGVYDISKRKAAEAQVEQLNHELEQHAQKLEFANRELEAFTYSVSHDLRAPLRALDGFSRILQEDFSAQLPSEAQRFLNLVRSNAQQMGNLINDLLNLSRLSRQPLKKQQVQLQQLVAEIYESLSQERDNRQVELVIGDLPDCEADPNLLKQVIVNLLSNALKFTRQCEAARIEVGHQVVEHEVVYFIKDNGVGFDMQYANKLFGLFQRLHRMEDFEGTGVGLAIIQRIIRRHGGRVWAEAEVNKGAAFYFTLGA
jgi:PAS domain S-box-containing protein